MAADFPQPLALHEQQRSENLGDGANFELSVRRDRTRIARIELAGLEKGGAVPIHPRDGDAAGLALDPVVELGLKRGGRRGGHQGRGKEKAKQRRSGFHGEAERNAVPIVGACLHATERSVARVKIACKQAPTGRKEFT
ncbi:MAG: hypothetical protein WDM96_01145 [Lacunisphaera sp.]